MFTSVQNLFSLPYKTKWRKLSFGCNALDNCTDGGIITRGITEISGESGTGKSQILMQLCLTVQLPKSYGGLEKKAIVIYSEGHFPIKRLSQIANTFSSQYSIKQETFLDGIFIQNILNPDKLIECLSDQLIFLLENNEIGLIIIDSIAALFRVENEYSNRATKFNIIGQKFLNIIQIYGCAIVFSNQVTGDGQICVPSLGLSWSHQIRNRFKTVNLAEIPHANFLYQQVIRKLEVLYSPEIASANQKPENIREIITHVC